MKYVVMCQGTRMFLGPKSELLLSDIRAQSYDSVEDAEQGVVAAETEFGSALPFMVVKKNTTRLTK